MGKGPGKSSSHWIIKYEEQEVAPGTQSVRAAYPKDKLQFKLLFKLLSWYCFC